MNTSVPEDLSYAVLNLDRGVTVARAVRVAGTSRARRKGLLGVEHLAEEAGMWIAPCEAIHTFGMKLAIDVLFLDKEFRVKKLIPSLAPRRIALCLSAASVLELQRGAAGRSGTVVGDRLKLESPPTVQE